MLGLMPIPYDEYTSVMDLPADFYLQTVKHVFQDFALPLGKLRSRGRTVELPAVERTALMTIEGESDDICGNGQTVAAHELCTGIPTECTVIICSSRLDTMASSAAAAGVRKSMRSCMTSSGRARWSNGCFALSASGRGAADRCYHRRARSSESDRVSAGRSFRTAPRVKASTHPGVHST